MTIADLSWHPASFPVDHRVGRHFYPDTLGLNTFVFDTEVRKAGSGVWTSVAGCLVWYASAGRHRILSSCLRKPWEEVEVRRTGGALLVRWIWCAYALHRVRLAGEQGYRVKDE